MSNQSRLDTLDLLRGCAALLVLSGHLRAYVLQSHAELLQSGVHLGVLGQMFYFATGLGHQAVVIFFALSGFLVGGKALRDIAKGRFAWDRYLLRRLTRLWIVIVPTLALTFVLDFVGLRLTGGAGYDGRYYDLFASGPRAPVAVDHSLLTFFGNLAFLQTISVPNFGSNGPMWSLANEFWYYVTFPLTAWLALTPMSLARRLVGLSILAGLAVVMPIWLLEGGAIWVAGAAAAWCAHLEILAPALRHMVLRLAAVVLLVGALVLSKISAAGIGDLTLGLSVATALPVLAHLPSPWRAYSVLSRGVSEISYTLYLTHFPLLTCIVLSGFAPNRFPPGIAGAGVYAGLLSLAVAWSIIVWWCFERHTDTVYSIVRARLVSREPAEAA